MTCCWCKFSVYWAVPLKVMSSCLCVNAAGRCCSILEDGVGNWCCDVMFVLFCQMGVLCLLRWLVGCSLVGVFCCCSVWVGMALLLAHRGVIVWCWLDWSKLVVGMALDWISACANIGCDCVVCWVTAVGRRGGYALLCFSNILVLSGLKVSLNIVFTSLSTASQ